MKAKRKWFIAIPRFVGRLLAYGLNGILLLVFVAFVGPVAFGALAYSLYSLLVTGYFLSHSELIDVQRLRSYVIVAVIVIAALLRFWKNAEGFTYGLMEFGVGLGITWIAFSSHTAATKDIL